MKSYELAKILDHTLLIPQATDEQISNLCKEAATWKFATIAIHPINITRASRLLQNSGVGITAAIAYPHGCWNIDLKCKEIEECLSMGATDCDYVIDIGALKENNLKKVLQEATACRKATGSAVLKAILEVSLLTNTEIANACRICADAGCNFVKTSTGYSGSPTEAQLRLIMENIEGSNTKLKAAGGFSTLDRIQMALDVGASRIGTSSSVIIMQHLLEMEKV
jgi:deoxyribose-phosphate aldolase